MAPGDVVYLSNAAVSARDQNELFFVLCTGSAGRKKTTFGNRLNNAET